MSARKMIDRICEDWDVYEDEDALMFLGGEPEAYADCIVGIVEGFGEPPKVCYDKHKVLRHFMKDGMSRTEALEYFDFNVIGAFMGKTTPIFITRYRAGRKKSESKKKSKHDAPSKNGADGVE